MLSKISNLYVTLPRGAMGLSAVIVIFPDRIYLLLMSDLTKTPGHADLYKDIDQEHVEKIIPERLFLSLVFEGMDILEFLLVNLLKQ